MQYAGRVRGVRCAGIFRLNVRLICRRRRLATGSKAPARTISPTVMSLTIGRLAPANILVHASWLFLVPLDMRVGTEARLTRVVILFGEGPNNEYVFANRCVNRM